MAHSPVGTSRAGLQGFQDGVVWAEFLYHALAVRPSIHAIDAHSFSSVASLVHTVAADLCREAAASPTTPPSGEAHHSIGPRCMLPRRLPPIVTHESAGRYCITFRAGCRRHSQAGRTPHHAIALLFLSSISGIFYCNLQQQEKIHIIEVFGHYTLYSSQEAARRREQVSERPRGQTARKA